MGKAAAKVAFFFVLILDPPYAETEKLPGLWMNRNMEISVLEIQGRHPVPWRQGPYH